MLVFWTSITVLKFPSSFICTWLDPSKVCLLSKRGRQAPSMELCQLSHRQGSHSFTSIATQQPHASWALCSRVVKGEKKAIDCNQLGPAGKQKPLFGSCVLAPFAAQPVNVNGRKILLILAGSGGRPGTSQALWADPWVGLHGLTSLRSSTHLFRWNYTTDQPFVVCEVAHLELAKGFCAGTPPVFPPQGLVPLS